MKSPLISAGGFVGRIGILAVALGIRAIGAGYGVAAADPDAEGGSDAPTARSGAQRGAAARRRPTMRPHPRRRPQVRAARGSAAPGVSSDGQDPQSVQVRLQKPTTSGHHRCRSSARRCGSHRYTGAAVPRPDHQAGRKPGRRNRFGDRRGAEFAGDSDSRADHAAAVAPVTAVVRAVLDPLWGAGDGLPLQSPRAVGCTCGFAQVRPVRHGRDSRSARPWPPQRRPPVRRQRSLGRGAPTRSLPSTPPPTNLTSAGCSPARAHRHRDGRFDRIAIVDNNHSYTVPGTCHWPS